MPTVISDARGPFGRNVAAGGDDPPRGARAAGFEIPIVTAGGICEFAQAEAILERGEADFVAAARQSLADPDWFQKIRLGRGGEIRRCEFTNYCEALDQQHKQVTCKLWDREMPDDKAVALLGAIHDQLALQEIRVEVIVSEGGDCGSGCACHGR